MFADNAKYIARLEQFFASPECDNWKAFSAAARQETKKWLDKKSYNEFLHISFGRDKAVDINDARALLKSAYSRLKTSILLMDKPVELTLIAFPIIGFYSSFCVLIKCSVDMKSALDKALKEVCSRSVIEDILIQPDKYPDAYRTDGEQVLEKGRLDSFEKCLKNRKNGKKTLLIANRFCYYGRDWYNPISKQIEEL